MKHYIDKSALVAKIENRIKELQNLYKEDEEKLDFIQKTAILIRMDECKVILSLLDTLEVKEVDLDKEISKYLDNGMELQLDWRECNNITVNPNGLRSFAKHFYELGLKTQKEEKV